MGAKLSPVYIMHRKGTWLQNTLFVKIDGQQIFLFSVILTDKGILISHYSCVGFMPECNASTVLFLKEQENLIDTITTYFTWPLKYILQPLFPAFWLTTMISPRNFSISAKPTMKTSYSLSFLYLPLSLLLSLCFWCPLFSLFLSVESTCFRASQTDLSSNFIVVTYKNVRKTMSFLKPLCFLMWNIAVVYTLQGQN